MATLSQVVLFSLAGGMFSLVGGLLLLSDKNKAKKLVKYLTPFAAGALLAAAFVDLLREASHQGSADTALVFTLVGILAFFVLERFLRWFHHHHEHKDGKTDPTVTLIIIGDLLHNFIDGIAIAAGFLVSFETGLVVTLAVAAHEIPQEIGDFGLLLSKGMDRAKVVWVNVISALATTVAAVIFFQLGQAVDLNLGAVLGLVAGFFIYIAVSDIIPSIHNEKSKKVAQLQTVILLIGAIAVSLLTITLHQYIDQGHDHEHEVGAHSEIEEHDDHEHDKHEELEHDEHEDEHGGDEKHEDPDHDEEMHGDHEHRI